MKPCWESMLGQTVEVEGQAFDAKLGAILETAHGILWIDALDFWPDVFSGRVVKAKGRIIKRHDLPVFIQQPGEPIRSGIAVPADTNLHEASGRYLLTSAEWTLVDEKE